MSWETWIGFVIIPIVFLMIAWRIKSGEEQADS